MVAFKPERPPASVEPAPAGQLDALHSVEARRRAPLKAEWLSKQQELLRDLKNCDATLNDAHHAIIGAGIADDSPEYFAAMERAIADAREHAAPHEPVADEPIEHSAPLRDDERGAPLRDDETPHVPEQRGLPDIRPAIRPPAAQTFERTVPVSAPVSRDNISWSGDRPPPKPGQVRLSSDQLEAARFSGVSAREYAEGVLKLAEAKKQGRYQERG